MLAARLLLALAILLGPVATARPAAAVPAHPTTIAATSGAPLELAVLARSETPEHHGSSIDPLTGRPGAAAPAMAPVAAVAGTGAAPASTRTEVFRERAPPR